MVFTPPFKSKSHESMVIIRAYTDIADLVAVFVAGMNE